MPDPVKPDPATPTVAPALPTSTVPAASTQPPNAPMPKPASAVLEFVKDHWVIGVLAIAIGALFLYSPAGGKFAEFTYGLLRMLVVLLATASAINLFFPGTVRTYLNHFGLVQDFFALEARHRVYVTVAIVLVLFWGAVKIFTSA